MRKRETTKKTNREYDSQSVRRRPNASSAPRVRVSGAVSESAVRPPRDPLSVRTRPPSVDRRPCQFLNVGHIILREIQFLSFVFFSFSLPFDLILTVWLLWVDRRSSLSFIFLLSSHSSHHTHAFKLTLAHDIHIYTHIKDMCTCVHTSVHTLYMYACGCAQVCVCV